MSFWSDSSTVTKGAIIMGLLGILYIGVAKFAGLPPFPSDETTQERGVSAQ